MIKALIKAGLQKKESVGNHSRRCIAVVFEDLWQGNEAAGQVVLQTRGIQVAAKAMLPGIGQRAA